MGRASKQLYHVLATQNNDGSTWNANGDYSVTPGSFRVQPAAGDVVQIQRVMVSIKDANIINTDTYGAITALTNGISMSIENTNDVTINQLTAFNIKTNGDWASHCYDMQILNLGSGEDYVLIRWTFARSGYPIILQGDSEEYIEVLLNDDLTGLTEHRFLFQGYYENKGFNEYSKG